MLTSETKMVNKVNITPAEQQHVAFSMLMLAFG